MAIWNDAAIEQLRALWAERPIVVTREIGERMGLTKNAVVGMAHRLKLPARPSPIIRHGPAQPRTARRKSPVRAPATTLPALCCAPADAAPAPASPRQPTSTHVCCWPLGEPGTPGFRFCGDPAELGRPYCETHRKIGCIPFVKPPKVKTDRYA